MIHLLMAHQWKWIEVGCYRSLSVTTHTNFYALTELNNLKVQTNTKTLQALTTRRGRSPRLRPPRTPRARPPRVPLEDTLHTQTPRSLWSWQESQTLAFLHKVLVERSRVTGVSDSWHFCHSQIWPFICLSVVCKAHHGIVWVSCSWWRCTWPGRGGPRSPAGRHQGHWPQHRT